MAKHIHRRRLVKGLAVTGVAGLAGCIGTGDPGAGSNGSGSNSSGSNSSGTAGGGSAEMAQSIEMWSASNAKVFQDLVRSDYMEANDSAKVSVTNSSAGDLLDKLKSSLISGTGSPDVAMVTGRFIPGIIDTNSLSNIGPQIREDGLKDKFISGVWQSASEGNKIYALPWDIGPTGLYYRRDVFEDAGIKADAIETWDDFMQEGKKLDSDTSLISLAPNEYANTWRFLFRQLKGTPITKDGKININSEKSIQVVKMMRDMKESGVANTSSAWTQNWFSAFKSGSTASVAMGAWFTGTLKAELSDTSGKWGVIKLPAFSKGGNRASKNGGSSLVIPKQISDKKQNRAFDFAKYGTANKKIMTKTYSEYGNFPAFKQVYGNKAFKQKDDFFDGQKVGITFSEVAKEIPGYQFTPITTTISDAVTQSIREVMNGKTPPKTAMQQAAKQVANNTDRQVA